MCFVPCGCGGEKNLGFFEMRVHRGGGGGQVVLGGDNVSPLVGIGFTDPPKYGGAAAPLASHLAAYLPGMFWVMLSVFCITDCSSAYLFVTGHKISSKTCISLTFLQYQGYSCLYYILFKWPYFTGP